MAANPFCKKLIEKFSLSRHWDGKLILLDSISDSHYGKCFCVCVSLCVIGRSWCIWLWLCVKHHLSDGCYGWFTIKPSCLLSAANFIYWAVLTGVCVCVLCSNNLEDHERSIFQRCEQHGYQLKEGVQFHLYISTSPCGDARIFSPHEAAAEGVNALLHLICMVTWSAILCSFILFSLAQFDLVPISSVQFKYRISFKSISV